MLKRNTLLRSLLLGAVALGPVAASAAGGALGSVTAARGEVQAVGPDGAARALQCGDPVFAGDTLSTGDGGQVGVLMDDMLATVSGGSTLRVDTTPDGAPAATLERGRVRVIDARADGVPGRLAARDTTVRITGNDAEAYLLSEKVGGYAMFCEWDAPLAASRAGESATASPGECVIAKPREPLYVADAHDERIPAGAASCPPDLGALARIEPPLTPADTRDVAAGPPPLAWSPMAAPLDPIRINPCDDPGSGCALSSGGRIIVDEPPPGTGGQPGSGGTFPGLQQ